MSEFKAPKTLVKSHNALKRRYLPNTYQVTPKPAIMFHRMRAAHSAASSSLQSFGFFDREAFLDGFVLRARKELPERIFEAVEDHRRENAELVAFLDELKAVSLYGPNGQKPLQTGEGATRKLRKRGKTAETIEAVPPPSPGVPTVSDDAISLDEEIRLLRNQLARKLQLQNAQLKRMLERFER
ncbi:hypothetical protein ACVJBD_007133 [Rhizobium mongolense]